MKKIVFLVLMLLAVIAGFGQVNKNDIIMTLENEKITLGDFDYIFKKNNNQEITTKQSLDEYIELFVNYKLKVKAAKDAKLDTNQSFINELKGYRKQLARPYLTDSEMLDQMTKEAYERKKTEVHARHILIRLDPDAEPKDTLIAWNKISALRTRVVAGGEDFVTVAKGTNGSEDPSAKDNGGDLGFFSAFQMVYPFEEAAYNTSVGNVSKILRTRYGYHILEVVETRQARGQVLVAHIMTKAGNQAGQATQDKAKEKIMEIHQKHLDGESFEELARKFSEDGTTSKKGGELPWFGTRKMVKSFEDVSFDLANIDDVSAPFRTEYGWHIVKKLDEKIIGDFDELKSEIKTKVSKDSRADKTKQSFLNKLRNEYSVQEKPKALKFIYKTADTSFFDKSWKMSLPKKLKKTVLKIEDQKSTLGDFNNYMNKKKRRANTDNAKEFIDATYNDWVKDELLDYENQKLEEKHEPFRLLMQEYRDGILLFELTDQLVWSKAIQDTTGLQNFYELNKQNYTWPDRYSVDVYTTNSEEIATQIVTLLNEGATKDSILQIVNESSNLNANLETGLFSIEEKLFLSELNSSDKGIYTIQHEGKTHVVHLLKFVPTKEKELNEAKGIITSDYQTHLEKAWIDSLRNKYNYTVNKDVLYSIANE